MRMIQSCWACKQEDFLRFKAGWISPEYNLMSWALSCLQISKYYKDVTLYADSVTAKILIDYLKLPYSNVVCNLDQLSKYPSHLWALSKILAYKQDTPFLHIDGDVFIWEPFSQELLDSELIAQNEEVSSDFHYENIISNLRKKLIYFPKELEFRETETPIHSYNAGIFGGNDSKFLKKFSQNVFDFVDRNLEVVKETGAINFNIIFEQYYFYCLTKAKKRKVNVLINELKGSQKYQGLGDFEEVPFKKKYLHLSGDYKLRPDVCNNLANRLRCDFPDHYYRIIALYKKCEKPLFRDFFSFSTRVDESSLKQMHEKLTNKVEILVEGLGDEQKDKLVKSYMSNLEARETMCPVEHLSEYKDFTKQLWPILKNKFSEINPLKLYRRDLYATLYFQLIFADLNKIYSKIISKGDHIEIIESNFDWTSIFENNVDFKLSPSSVSHIIIPECDQNGFSVVSIDELDIILLDLLCEPMRIDNLMMEIKLFFNPEDVKESEQNFENLIFNRIKKGLNNKSIRLNEFSF